MSAEGDIGREVFDHLFLQLTNPGLLVRLVRGLQGGGLTLR